MATRTSGNTAFDAYKADTLKRLMDEQEQFEAFLDRLIANRLPRKTGGIILTHMLNERGRVRPLRAYSSSRARTASQPTSSLPCISTDTKRAG